MHMKRYFYKMKIIHNLIYRRWPWLLGVRKKVRVGDGRDGGTAEAGGWGEVRRGEKKG